MSMLKILSSFARHRGHGHTLSYYKNCPELIKSLRGHAWHNFHSWSPPMWQNVKNTYQFISDCPILRHFRYEIQIVEVQKEHASVEASPELFCSVSSACPSDFRGCLILFCRHSFTIHSFIHSLSPLVKKTAHGGNQAVGRTLCLALAWDKMPELDRLRVDTFRWFSDFGIPNHFYLS